MSLYNMQQLIFYYYGHKKKKKVTVILNRRCTDVVSMENVNLRTGMWKCGKISFDSAGKRHCCSPWVRH